MLLDHCGHGSEDSWFQRFAELPLESGCHAYIEVYAEAATDYRVSLQRPYRS